MEAVIRQAITDVCIELGVSPGDFTVEHPVELTHGDYACNVAMVAAKAAGKNPRALAEAIVEKLDGAIEYVDTVEVAGPGFINFSLARDFFVEEIARATALGDAWGENDSWEGKRVLIEYTDPNPFKEFHIGHLFTNSVGEAIARLFAANGAEVKRCNYQGDVGLHVAHAIYGMQKLSLTPEQALTAADLGKAYAYGANAYKDDEGAQIAIRTINKKIYDRSDDTINALYDKGRSISLGHFETIYSVVGTEFDEYFFESEAAPQGKVLVLAHPDVFTDSDGAKIFNGEPYGLHTRVFLNSEGLPTYEAKELALAKLKDERFGGYDHSVISTANEVSDYFKVLLKAMSFVYPELASKTEHIGHGTVRLQSGKMSSRTGDVIAALDFIGEIKEAAAAKMTASGESVDEAVAEAVAVAAIKYATLKGSIHQDSIFDKTKALSFEGDSGPYLQYTHARICSVLAKAKANGVVPSIAKVREEPYEIEKLLYRFPEVVQTALRDRAPHQVVGFLTQLAGSFNTFYAHEQIADGADEDAPYKAAVAEAVAHTLKNGLWILGIEAPEHM